MEIQFESNVVNGIPLANNYGPEFLVIERGDGVWLKDVSGNRYLDFTAGIAVNALGYGRKDLAEVAYDQMVKVIHTSNLYTTPPVIELARRLIETGSMLGNDGFAAVHFSNSGSEANETALKYARLYSYRKKGRGHDKILSFSGAFHGRTMGALSCTPTPKYQDPFQPLVPDIIVAEYNDVNELYRVLDSSFAAVIVEVVQGEGGLNVMSEEFAAALNDLCSKNDVVLIADEVQTGLSRTGTFYASTGVGLKPNIVTLAKPLAAGLPLSATLIPGSINSLIHVGEHGSTFGGGPVTASVALRVLDVLLDERFISDVREKGEYFGELLEELGNEHELLGRLRGKGLLRGIELLESGDVDTGKVISLAREKGILILRSGKNILRFAPPLIISKSELVEGINILDKVIGELENNMGHK